MKKNGIVLLAVLPLLVIGKYTIQPSELKTGDPEISSYTIDPRQQTLGFFWKDKAGNTIKNFQALQQSVAAENRQLVFAMNGGMFKKGLSPQGLYVENGKMLAPLDTVQDGYGNFYLQPNGVFYLTDDKRAFVVQTRDFVFADNIQFATQSGPMLLIDGALFTVSTNDVLATPGGTLVSATLRVMVAVPETPPEGVTLIRRAAPPPERSMPDAGTSAGFEEDAVTVRRFAGVPESPTVKDRNPVGLP